jgi:hypothetical protein
MSWSSNIVMEKGPDWEEIQRPDGIFYRDPKTGNRVSKMEWELCIMGQ